MLHNRYIPDNSMQVTRDGIDAIAYSYIDSRGNLAAIAYKGKAIKPTWHYIFKTIEQRNTRINQLFDAAKSQQDDRADRKTRRVEFRHGYRVGDVLYSSWGYDQTNIEFYQVISTTQKTITFREVCQIVGRRDSWASDSWETSPDRGNFKRDEKEFTRTVSAPYDNKGKGSVSFAEYEGGYMKRLYEFDGAPKYASDGH